MKEIPVTFNSKGQQIIGMLHIPDKSTQALIILAHGFTGNKNGPDNIFIKTASKLCDNGFAVLRFDFRGSGESNGEFVDMTINGEVSDLKKVIQWIEKQGYEKIGLIGESMGGAVSILGYNNKIKCLVLWYPAIYLNKTIGFKFLDENKEKIKKEGLIVEKRDGRQYKVGWGFYQERSTIEVASHIKNITCPLLIITGDKDTSVPHDQSEKAIKIANEPKKLEIIEGADHCFRGFDREKWQDKAINLTIDWFNKWLK